MLPYFFKRLLWMIPTFLGITFITFFVIKLAPDQSRHMRLLLAGGGVSPDQLVQMQNATTPVIALPVWYEDAAQAVGHVFEPATPQATDTLSYRILIFSGRTAGEYMIWLTHFLQGDWGYSSKDYRPVAGKLMQALPATLAINFLSLLFIYGVSFPLGIWCSRHDGTRFEKWVMIKLFLLYGLPSFWLATLMLTYLAGGDYLNWFPLGGLHTDGFEAFSFWGSFVDLLWHLTLPVVVTSLAGLAFLTRFVKENMLTTLQKDFVRTAYAKGLPERRVLWRHALRNAILPFVTLLGTLLPAMIGGSVIVEQMFAIPGMGFLGFEAILAQDHNMIMAIATLGAVLTLWGLFLQDILYAWLDPRVKF